MNDNIASLLKQLRKAACLSVKQAASQLKCYGIDIASKTLYGYESGLSMPNADVFVALCKIYHCGHIGQAEGVSFSQDELSFLNDYKKLDACGQEAVRYIMEHEKERVRQLMDRNAQSNGNPIPKDKK